MPDQTNTPSPLHLEVRQGSTFGPVVITLEGVDLTGHTLTSGVESTGIPATTEVTSGTECRYTLPARLTEALRPRTRPYVWWLDTTAPDGTVTPLVAGTITVLARGAANA